MTERTARAGRAGVAAAASTLVALTAHMSAGGAVPSPLLVTGVVALAWMLSLPAARLRRGAAGIVGMALMVALSQAVFHAVFEWLGLATAASGTQTAMAAHHHGHDVLMAMETLHSSSAAPMMMSTAMLTVHAAAAAVTLLGLLFGERSLDALLRCALRPARLLGHAPHPRPRRVPSPPHDRACPVRRTLASPALLRGPPPRLHVLASA